MSAQPTRDVLFCTSCRRWKPIEDFSKNRANPTGRQTKCRDCDRKIRRWNRWAKVYGFSEALAKRTLEEEQRFTCPVCYRPLTWEASDIKILKASGLESGTLEGEFLALVHGACHPTLPDGVIADPPVRRANGGPFFPKTAPEPETLF